MAPWMLAVIFVVVLGGTGWLVDRRARARRRGLDRVYTGGSGATNRIAQVESARPGTTTEALGNANVNWQS